MTFLLCELHVYNDHETSMTAEVFRCCFKMVSQPPNEPSTLSTTELPTNKPLRWMRVFSVCVAPVGMKTLTPAVIVPAPTETFSARKPPPILASRSQRGPDCSVGVRSHRVTGPKPASMTFSPPDNVEGSLAVSAAAVCGAINGQIKRSPLRKAP